jgi:hypothetical protein
MLASDARSGIWLKIKISNFKKVIVESQKSYVYESHWIFYFIFWSPSGENWRPKEKRAYLIYTRDSPAKHLFCFEWEKDKIKSLTLSPSFTQTALLRLFKERKKEY